MLPAWGVDGVVCSALELPAIRAAFPNSSRIPVVPGIRPDGSAANDQARIMTPSPSCRQAGRQRGRDRQGPITESPNPRQVVENALRDLSSRPASAIG